MNRSLAVAVFFASATSAFAAQTTSQTPTAPPGSVHAAGPETVTLIGCVTAGAAASDPFTLSEVTQGSVGATTPGGVTAGVLPPQASAVPAPPAVTSPTAQPAAVPTPRAPATPTAPPTPTAAGATGTAGTAAVPAAAAMPPTVGAGTASTMGTPAGYRLSGYDVAAYRGQRVQMVGSFDAPSAPGATPAAGTNPQPASGVREFRVQSVTPVAGTCAQR